MIIILFFGIRRSGNHFVISQIINNFKNIVHMNDVELSYTEYNIYKNIEITQNRIDCKYTGFKNAECIIISMENKIINFNELQKFNSEKNVYPIILLRNPYNMAASAWKVYKKNIYLTKEIIDLWILYANIFIENNNLIKILYDEFNVNENYAYNILNIIIKNPIIDKNIKITHQISSFNDNNSQKSYGNIEDCIYYNDPDFIQLFNDINIIKNIWNKIK
jgi:hypothetical protein